MATPLQPTDLVQVRLWCTNSEQASVNSFWYLISSVGSPAASDQDLATELGAGFMASVVPPVINNLTTYNGVQAQIHRLALGIPIVFAAVSSVTGAGPGTGGAIALPRQTAGLTHWSTHLAGRAYRGRTYWPFPATAHDTGDGTPTTAYVTAINAIASGLVAITGISGSGTAGCNFVINHRKNKAGIIPPQTFIISGTSEAKWGTQRRRGSFGRPNVSPI
jgi:hypothetical protein